MRSKTILIEPSGYALTRCAGCGNIRPASALKPIEVLQPGEIIGQCPDCSGECYPYRKPASKAKPIQKPATQISALLNQAEKIGLAEVERLARQAMKRYPRCKSFCMAMGGACFYDSTGHPIDDSHAAYKPLWTLLDEYNNYLKLTGCPMKIKGCDGPTLTDW